jgi:uncharacterized membrane protein
MARRKVSGRHGRVLQGAELEAVHDREGLAHGAGREVRSAVERTDTVMRSASGGVRINRLTILAAPEFVENAIAERLERARSKRLRVVRPEALA